MVKSIQQLTLEAVYPAASADINLNTCGDPDCGNYGVAPDFTLPVFKGKDADKRKQEAAASIPALSSGRGAYTMTSANHQPRISEPFEYETDPVGWDDGRSIVCGHQRGNGECGIKAKLLSNEHFLEEWKRLETVNGLLEGPVCGHCGTRYLDHPEEFIFNGTHGKLKPRGNRKKPKPSGFRIIHRQCKGKPGARISVSLDHQAQKAQHDNVQILRELVEATNITSLRRLISDPDTGKKIGVGRLYSRIFWLEKTLLAFERAKLKEWKAGVEASDRFSHMRIAHDDVTISVNWESRFDRRLTPLQFTVSADIRSGYVFRIDANFDPRFDPVEYFEQNYLDKVGNPTNLRQTYTQASGVTFTAPNMQFQRPSGRFDEALLFASAEGRWRVFEERISRAYEDEIALGMALPKDVERTLRHAGGQRAMMDEIRNRYFGLKDSDRDYRGSFNGSVVKPTYTKAAHLASLRDMLPKGKITLVGEQESTMVRVVPHVFRDMIADDLFEWFVISFDKEVSSPRNKTRTADFKADFGVFKKAEKSKGGEDVPDYEMLERFCAEGLSTAYHEDPNGTRTAYTIENFKSKQFPQIWTRSPVQHYGETEKVVGYPVLPKKYRAQMKQLAFDQEILDKDLRAALARRTLKATIQPVSAFMNSLRWRTSPTERAGGNTTRNGPAYINGAVFNPAVLIAILNIYRIYYNWFENRQYVAGGTAGESTEAVRKGLSSVKVPGSKETLQVPKRRKTTPVMRTPAMRLGADPVEDPKKTQRPPDPRRILYRPGLYHGTPLWRKFEDR